MGRDGNKVPKVWGQIHRCTLTPKMKRNKSPPVSSHRISDLMMPKRQVSVPPCLLGTLGRPRSIPRTGHHGPRCQVPCPSVAAVWQSAEEVMSLGQGVGRRPKRGRRGSSLERCFLRPDQEPFLLVVHGMDEEELLNLSRFWKHVMSSCSPREARTDERKKVRW